MKYENLILGAGIIAGGYFLFTQLGSGESTGSGSSGSGSSGIGSLGFLKESTQTPASGDVVPQVLNFAFPQSGKAAATETPLSKKSSGGGGSVLFNAQGQTAVFSSTGQGVILDTNRNPIASTNYNLFKPVGSGDKTKQPLPFLPPKKPLPFNFGSVFK